MGLGSVSGFAQRLEEGRERVERKRERARPVWEPPSPEERAEDRMSALKARNDYWRAPEEAKRLRRAQASSMRLTDYPGARR